MKLRCPYCHEVFESKVKTAACPKCGRTSLAGGFFARSPKVTKEGRRRRRDSSTVQPWLMSGRIMGLFLLWSGIPRWLIWLLGLSVIGAFVFYPRGTPDFPELRKSAQESISVLRVALDFFKEDCGRYPLPSEGLNALMVKPNGLDNWHGPYVIKLLRDPWKHAYIYEPDDGGKVFDLRSAGPDGVRGTKDDVLPALQILEGHRVETPAVTIITKKDVK